MIASARHNKLIIEFARRLYRLSFVCNQPVERFPHVVPGTVIGIENHRAIGKCGRKMRHSSISADFVAFH
jgi:hypothetical protein